MRYGCATKLHNEDEVVIKSTGDIGVVNSIEIGDKQVLLNVVFPNGSYRSFSHKEVK